MSEHLKNFNKIKNLIFCNTNDGVFAVELYDPVEPINAWAFYSFEMAKRTYDIEIILDPETETLSSFFDYWSTSPKRKQANAISFSSSEFSGLNNGVLYLVGMPTAYKDMFKAQ